MNQLITLRHNATSVAFDTSADLWCLTDLWRAAGSPENREPWNWARFEGQRYLQALAATLNMIWDPENLCVTQVLAGEDHVSPHAPVAAGHLFETRQGRGGGTWAHQLAGLEYARYLSPELAIACNQFLLDYWRGTHQPAPDRLADLERRLSALEQAHTPQQERSEEHLTITISLTTQTRVQLIRELGGTVTPQQFFAALRQHDPLVQYVSVLQWLHKAARRGVLRRRRRGQYSLPEDDE
jgi:hypothetical protein